MSNTAVILVAALLRSPEGLPPPPTIEPQPQPPVESPARPAEPDPLAEVESDDQGEGESGIEFATRPPEDADESESSEAAAPYEAASWPDPGTAPSDGMGLVTSGAILVPGAALLSWQLLRVAGGPQDKVAIFVTGGLMEAMALAFIGTGLYRRAKLKRWTVAYRVVARPQGAGLLSAGGIALSGGVSLAAVGIVALTTSSSVAGGATVLGIGLAGAAVAAPLIIYGKRRRETYLRTGGWYRPALPTVQLVPQIIVNRDSLGLGIAGRF